MTKKLKEKNVKRVAGSIQAIIIFWIVVIILIIILINIFSGQSSNENPTQAIPVSQVSTNLPSNPQPSVITSTFNKISQADQDRMKEIILGVMQNTIPVTPDLKNELKNIFAKYNATDAEINDFATYGPAIAVIYQKLFFTDALQSVSSGIPVKSSERLNFETEALSRGLMTSERIQSTDEEMKLIANHQPITGLDGKEVILTADAIKSTLNNIDSTASRLQSLLE
jgi:cytoskeletal protein RodZ